MKNKMTFTAAVLACILLSFPGCGEDLVIDVNTLPCGTARGNAGSGIFDFSGVLLDYDECINADFPGPFWVHLPGSVSPVVVNHYEPGVTGCESGRLEVLFPSTSEYASDYTLKGGIWTDGSFRVGQAIMTFFGYTYRILMDGKYAPFEKGDPPRDYFSGSGTVNLSYEAIECTYTFEFSGTRITQ